MIATRYTSDRLFSIDTNILIYAIDGSDRSRQAVAAEIVRLAAQSPECCLTLQVLGEFFFAVSRRRILPPEIAADTTVLWKDLFTIACPTESALSTALGHVLARRLSYWDGLILATAAEAGCTAILSEDMQDGATIGGVRVINPFGPDGLSVAASLVLRGESGVA